MLIFHTKPLSPWLTRTERKRDFDYPQRSTPCGWQFLWNITRPRSVDPWLRSPGKNLLLSSSLDARFNSLNPLWTIVLIQLRLGVMLGHFQPIQDFYDSVFDRLCQRVSRMRWSQLVIIVDGLIGESSHSFHWFHYSPKSGWPWGNLPICQLLQPLMGSMVLWCSSFKLNYA